MLYIVGTDSFHLQKSNLTEIKVHVFFLTVLVSHIRFYNYFRSISPLGALLTGEALSFMNGNLHFRLLPDLRENISELYQ